MHRVIFNKTKSMASAVKLLCTVKISFYKGFVQTNVQKASCRCIGL
mgnify:CR=1 FL=1